MKSSYELAMERLKRQQPSVSLTPQQKEKLAELDSIYAAKIAQREIQFNQDIAAAVDRGDSEGEGLLRRQLGDECRSLRADLEEKKEQVRKG